MKATGDPQAAPQPPPPVPVPKQPPAAAGLKPPGAEVRTVLNSYTRPLTPYSAAQEASSPTVTGRRKSLLQLEPVAAAQEAAAGPRTKRDAKKLQAANILRDLGQQLEGSHGGWGGDGSPPPGRELRQQPQNTERLSLRKLEASVALRNLCRKLESSQSTPLVHVRRDLQARQAKEGVHELKQLNQQVIGARRDQAPTAVFTAGPRERAAQRKDARRDERGRAPRPAKTEDEAATAEVDSEEEVRPDPSVFVQSSPDRRKVVEKLMGKLPNNDRPEIAGSRRATVAAVSLGMRSRNVEAMKVSSSDADVMWEASLDAEPSAAPANPKAAHQRPSSMPTESLTDEKFQAGRLLAAAEQKDTRPRSSSMRNEAAAQGANKQQKVSAQRLQITKTFLASKDSLGEVHKDNVLKALEAYGIPVPNPSLAFEVYDKITNYNSLNLDEFIRFVTWYEAREEAAAGGLFAQFDTKKNGRMCIDDVGKLLAACGVTPMDHVVKAIVDEVREADKEEESRASNIGVAEKRRRSVAAMQAVSSHDLGALDAEGSHDEYGITFLQFKQLLVLLRTCEGFSQSEVDNCMHMFDDYDASGDHKLDAREIMSVLCRHGYALDVKGVSSIIHEIKGQHIDTLDRNDFLKFMRKAREREIAVVRDLFVNCDSDGSAGISFNELGSILGSLGYVPQAKTINEAAADIGLHKGIHRDLTFAEVWQFLEIYRLHHGLSQTDYAEVESAYKKFDSDGNGVLDPPEVARLLRYMGYPITYQTCMRLLSLELDSTHIDLQEFVELVRKYRERLTKIIYAEITANEEQKESPGAVRLSSNSYFAKRRVSFSAAESAATPTSAAATASNAKQPGGNMQNSVSRAMAVLEEGRSTVKKNSGFDPKEIEDLKKQFVYYDTDHSGEISKSELHPLFGDLFPELMTLASGSQTRRELQRLFDEADSDHNRALSFLEFLQLVRKWSDYQDGVRYRMEVQATEQTGFSAREVAEFRELFMGDGGQRTQLDYEDLCKMLQHVVPLGHKNLAQLAEVFEDMAPLATPDVRKADFSDFLLIMKHLLDINFAGISSIDSGSKRPRSSD